MGVGGKAYIYSDCSFSGSSRYYVQGYQEPTQSGYDIKIAYNFEEEHWYGWLLLLSQAKFVSGTWPESNWFPTLTYDNLNTSYAYRLRVSNSDASKPASVAGNIWRP